MTPPVVSRSGPPCGRKPPRRGPLLGLLVATVVGLIAAPILDQHAGGGATLVADHPHRGLHRPDAAPSQPATSPRRTPSASSSPSTSPVPTETPTPTSTPTPTPSGGGAQGGVASHARTRSETVARIGVVSMNEFHDLPVAEARSDAVAVTSRQDVDVVGWQEADHYHGMLRSLHDSGWDTKTYAGDSRELAVSWRASTFSYVSSHVYFVSKGEPLGKVRYPFGGRDILRVTLRHKASGHLFTVLDTHLPQKIEDLTRPGHFRTTANAQVARAQLRKLDSLWNTVTGRWVVGTGDYNFDDFADARVKPAGGIAVDFAGKAISSWDVLGKRGTGPTHPNSGRRIDYVFVSHPTYAAGHARFLSQRTIDGLHSDHRPLLVRLSLR